MLTTHPTPELASPPAAGEAARLAGHARLAAAALLAFGSAGLLAGLLTANALGVLLAMGGCGAGAYLLWSARQPGPEGDYPEGAGGRAADVPVGQAGRQLLQAAALACDALAALGKALLKVLACAVAGAGVGLVTVGAFALREPEAWRNEVVRWSGPPLGPALLGAGAGLLTAEVLLLILFRRSWPRAARLQEAAPARG